MKLAYALVTVVTLSAVNALAQDKAAKNTATFILPSEVKWADVPEAPGVKIAVVEGNAATGAHHFFLKFAPGFKIGAHHHSADHFATIVSGNLVLTVDGKENKLPPGSFVGFTQKTKHATRCEAGADCVMFISAKEKWDAVMADTKPAAAKK